MEELSFLQLNGAFSLPSESWRDYFPSLPVNPFGMIKLESLHTPKRGKVDAEDLVLDRPSPEMQQLVPSKTALH